VDHGEQLANQVGGSLNPDWVRWLMGWPVGWDSAGPLGELRWEPWDAEPEGVPRVATGVADRVQRLKALGNGQVPPCAAVAWDILTTDL
jgi:DNA (cytosine-5)-methyltransferase 1